MFKIRDLTVIGHVARLNHGPENQKQVLNSTDDGCKNIGFNVLFNFVFAIYVSNKNFKILKAEHFFQHLWWNYTPLILLSLSTTLFISN